MRRLSVVGALVFVVLVLAVGAGAIVTLGSDAPSALQMDDLDGEGDHGAHGEGGDHGAHGEGGDHGAHGEGSDHGDGMMLMDMEMVPNGTVVNENTDDLPPGCEELVGERDVTIRGGVGHSEAGEMFAFDRDRLELDPCTAVTVTFVNEDEIRHQWMIHGLPTETYPMGMFNVEVTGPASVTATFITPGEDTTLYTHCSLPQHEQKGMAMEVVIGEGGDGHDPSDGDGHAHRH